MLKVDKKKYDFKFHIKSGDTVKVISGNARGKTGTVLSVDRVNYRAVVEGVNMVKRHTKPSAKNPQGGIIEKESGIHISNLMVVESATGQPTRIGRKANAEGKLQRYSKKTGDFIQ